MKKICRCFFCLYLGLLAIFGVSFGVLSVYADGVFADHQGGIFQNASHMIDAVGRDVIEEYVRVGMDSDSSISDEWQGKYKIAYDRSTLVLHGNTALLEAMAEDSLSLLQEEYFSSYPDLCIPIVSIEDEQNVLGVVTLVYSYESKEYKIDSMGNPPLLMAYFDEETWDEFFTTHLDFIPDHCVVFTLRMGPGYKQFVLIEGESTYIYDGSNALANTGSGRCYSPALFASTFQEQLDQLNQSQRNMLWSWVKGPVGIALVRGAIALGVVILLVVGLAIALRIAVKKRKDRAA